MAKSLNNEYNKETGARILIYFLSRIANINGMGINPILTFYYSHFLRIFALTYKDKRKISKSFENYGYIVHCNNCGTRSVMPNNLLKFKPKCSNCNNETSISYAGPLWIGEIHNADFIQKILDLNELKNYDNKDRIAKLLKMCLDEIEMPVTYYNIHRLSKTLALSNIPKIEEIIREINKEGFKASRTHFDFVSIKTDMDIGNIIQILTTQ